MQKQQETALQTPLEQRSRSGSGVQIAPPIGTISEVRVVRVVRDPAGARPPKTSTELAKRTSSPSHASW
jgi:hypothetical protein